MKTSHIIALAIIVLSSLFSGCSCIQVTGRVNCYPSNGQAVYPTEMTWGPQTTGEHLSLINETRQNYGLPRHNSR